MSIASELQNYADGLDDAYDAVNDMSGIIPQHKNMNNLDQAIRTIPQNTGTTYTAGYGINIDANDEISVDTTDIAEVSDIPTNTSDLVNDGSDGTSTYVEADELATVATSGDYDDLLNKPNIPAVYDATLTIQRNSSTVASFSANADTNAVADITVPTDTSDLTNGAGYITGYTAGSHIDITSGTISAEDYVHSENPIAAVTPSSTLSGAYITNGSITADKAAAGEFLTLTLSTTDIGEGAALADNTLYGVYS